MRRIRVETDDGNFLSDLKAARIEGLDVSMRLEAAAGQPDVWLYTIEIAKAVLPMAGPLLIKWLHDRYAQKRSKTTIDGIVIPKGLKHLTIIVMGGEVPDNPQRRPRQKKKKQKS